MNGPTGAEVTQMMANDAASYTRGAERQRWEAADIIHKWIPNPEDTDAMSPEEMSEVITDLVAAVRVLSGLPAYETPRQKWLKEN